MCISPYLLGVWDLAAMADDTRDVGLDGAVFVGSDGVAQRLSVAGQCLVVYRLAEDIRSG